MHNKDLLKVIDYYDSITNFITNNFAEEKAQNLINEITFILNNQQIQQTYNYHLINIESFYKTIEHFAEKYEIDTLELQ